jgi:cytoskeletal protein RodZ
MMGGMSIGADLEAARGRAGLTVVEVSQRTRIRQSVIEAIESDDFSDCGGDFYARGDIRAIARAVGADPEPLIRDYDEAYRAPGEPAAAELFRPIAPVGLAERRSVNWTAVLGLALLVVVAAVAYLLVAGPGRTPAGTSASNRQHSRPTAAPSSRSASPLAPGTLVVRLDATQNCWVGFTTLRGGYLFQTYLVAGTVRTWTFHRAVEMRLGNPSGVMLTVNGAHPLRPGQINPVTLSLRPASG